MSKGEAIMSAPPVTLVGVSLVGVSLEDWVYGVTLFWLVLQIGWFIYRRFMQWNNKNWKGEDTDDE